MVRTVTAALLTILLVPALVLANLSTWSLRTVVDDDTFATTVGRSLDTPAMERLMADAVTSIVVTNVDLSDPRVQALSAQALGLTSIPSRATLEAELETRVVTALGDPRVEAARDEAISGLHAVLLGAARGSNEVVRFEGEDVVVDLYPMIERAADSIDARLVAVVRQEIAPGTTRLVVASADGIRTVSATVTVLDTLRWVIPLLVVVACLVIVVLAHRRVRALGMVGVAVLLAGVVSLAVVWVGARSRRPPSTTRPSRRSRVTSTTS